MDEKQLQLLYNEYAKGKGFANYNEFKSLMGDSANRRMFFDDSNKELGFKDYNEFEGLLGVKKKVGLSNIGLAAKNGSPATSGRLNGGGGGELYKPEDISESNRRFEERTGHKELSLGSDLPQIAKAREEKKYLQYKDIEENQIKPVLSKVASGVVQPEQLSKLYNTPHGKKIVSEVINNEVPEVGSMGLGSDVFGNEKKWDGIAQAIQAKNRQQGIDAQNQQESELDIDLINTFANSTYGQDHIAVRGGGEAVSERQQKSFGEINTKNAAELSEALRNINSSSKVWDREGNEVNKKGLAKKIGTRLFQIKAQEEINPEIIQLSDKIKSAVGKVPVEWKKKGGSDDLSNIDAQYISDGLNYIRDAEPGRYVMVMGGIDKLGKIGEADYQQLVTLGKDINSFRKFKQGEYVKEDKRSFLTKQGKKALLGGFLYDELNRTGKNKQTFRIPQKDILEAYKNVPEELRDDDLLLDIIKDEVGPAFGFLPIAKGEGIPKKGLGRQILINTADPFSGILNTIDYSFDSPFNAYMKSKELDRGDNIVINAKGEFTNRADDKFLNKAVGGLFAFLTQVGIARAVGAVTAKGTNAMIGAVSPRAATITTSQAALNVGTPVSIIAQQYGDEYVDFLEKTGSPTKAALGAFVSTATQGAIERFILPDVKIADKAAALFARKNLAKEIINVIENGGGKAGVGKVIKDFTANTLGVFGKEAIAEENLQNFANYLTEAVISPKTVQDRSLMQETEDITKAAIVQMAIPAVLGGAGETKIKRGLNKVQFNHIGVNADVYQQALDNQLVRGMMTQEEHDLSSNIIQLHRNNILNAPKYDSKGELISAERQLEYAYQSTVQETLQQQADKQKDKIQREPIEKKIEEAENIKRQIFNGEEGSSLPSKKGEPVVIDQDKDLMDEGSEFESRPKEEILVDVPGAANGIADKGVREAFLTNPEKGLAEVAQQLHSTTGEAETASNTYGNKISDLALELYPTREAADKALSQPQDKATASTDPKIENVTQKSEGVTNVKLSELPDRAFAVGMGKEEADAMRKKLSEEGFTQPIIIDKESGNVLDGQHRLMIADELGIKEVPAIYMDNPTKSELNAKIKELEKQPKAGSVGVGGEDFTAKGGNKIVDEKGDPITVYHGTTGDVSGGFKPNSLGTYGEHEYYYFAKDKKWVSKFKEEEPIENRSKFKIGEYQLDIRNPLDVSNKFFTVEDWIKHFEDNGIELSEETIKDWNRRAESNPRQTIGAWQLLRNDNGKFRTDLINGGYDGLIISDKVRGRADNTVYVALKNEQIRPKKQSLKEQPKAPTPTQESSTRVEGAKPVGVVDKPDETFYTGRKGKVKDFSTTRGDFIFFSKNKETSEWYGGDESNVTEAKIDTKNFIDLSSQEKKAEFVKDNLTRADVEELYKAQISHLRFDADKEKLINNKLQELQSERFSGDNDLQKWLLNKVKEKGYSGAILQDAFFGKHDMSYVVIDKSVINKPKSETPSPKEGEQATEVKSTRASEAKKVYRDIGEVDEPTDARGLALEYLAGGNKISEASINEIAGTVQKASLNTGAKEKKSSEAKARDYVSKDGKTVDEIAHSIWDNLPENLKDSITTRDLKNELNDVINSHNTRLSAALEFRDRYIAKDVRDNLTEAEAKAMNDADITRRSKIVEELPENQQNELVDLLAKYENEYGIVDWERLEKDTNGFSPDILSLSIETQNALDAIIQKNISQTTSEPNNAVNKDGAGKKEKAEERLDTAISNYNKAVSELKKAEDKISKTQATQSGMFDAAQKEMFGVDRNAAKEILDPLRLQVKEKKSELDAAQIAFDNINEQPKLKFNEEETKVSDTQKESGVTDEGSDKKSEGTGSGKPPGETGKEEKVGDERKGGITHEGTKETTQKAGLPDYEKGEPITHEERISAAKKAITDNPNLADEIMTKVEKGGNLTPQDNAVLAVYKAALDSELDKNPSKEVYDRVSRIAKVLNPEGTYAGQLLESRKLIDFNEDNLSNFLMGKEAAQGTALSEKQVKDESAKFTELKKAKDALAELEAADKEAYNKLVAEIGVNKAKAAARKASKKTKEEHIADRKAIVEKAREALKKIRGNSSLKSTIPGLAELKALAPHVKNYMQDLLNEGVDKFDNIVSAIHAEFKDVLDNLRKSDVIDILAGNHDEVKEQTRNEKANSLRLIKREAALIKELADARKGIDKEKSETKKTTTNRRIDELTEKIKEVKRLRKNEVEQEPVEDVTVGSAEALNKEVDRLAKKADKLLDDIKNKKYLEEKAKPTVFKKSRKAQLLEDRVIDLENKIRHERSVDEYGKRSKARRIFDKVMEFLGVRRLVQSALDMSVPLRQGATLLSPRRIDVWAKGFKANLQSVFNPKKFERIMRGIRQDPMYHDMVKDGVVFNDLSSADPNLHNEDFRKSFVYKIPILSEPLKASNRSADAFLNIARYELYKKFRAKLEKQGLTRESDPKAFNYAGNWAMSMTGRGNMHSSLEKPAMNAILGNTFYGARLMASRFNLLNPVTYFDPRVPRQAKVEAMKDMASFTVTVMTIAIGLAAAGGAVSLDPDDPDFLKIRFGDKVYDISGGLVNYVRTFLRIAKAGYTKATGTKEEGDKATAKAGQSTLQFFRNKLSPNTSYGVDAFFGKPYGKDFDPTEIYQIYPMYTDDVLKSLKDDGIMAIPTVLLPNILGLGYANYPSRDDKSQSQGNTLTKEDVEKYPVFKEFSEKGIRPPEFDPKQIATKEVLGKETQHLSDYPKETQDKFISAKKRYWAEELQNLKNGEYKVYRDRGGTVHIAGKKTDISDMTFVTFKDLTPEEIQYLSGKSLSGKATRKTKEEMNLPILESEKENDEN